MRPRGLPDTPEVNIAEAVDLIAAGAFLLDVREDDEWQAGHAQAATHIALGLLGDALDQLPKEDKVVVICRSGARSARATDALVGRGYDALNVAGGMQAWEAAGQVVVAEDGTPGEVI